VSFPIISATHLLRENLFFKLRGGVTGKPEVYRFVGRIGTDKRPRVQERHWAHFVSAIRLSKSSPSRTMTPKPAAGLQAEVVNDKGRYHSRLP
jgi:hypothetical protein